MKGKESLLANYFKSIPKKAVSIHHEPIMKDGKFVGNRVTYVLNDVLVVKNLPADDYAGKKGRKL